MKKGLLTILLLLPFSILAEPLEQEAIAALPRIAALYADGYAKLDNNSLQARLLYKDKEGECTVITSFQMEGFSGAPNSTQFIGFFNCPTFHKLIKANRKLFMSDLYRFFIGEPKLDINTARVEENLIKLDGMSNKTKRPVTAIFEPSGGPGWWRLKQVRGMAMHEVLMGR